MAGGNLRSWRLPTARFVAQVTFTCDQLLRFQAKIGDVVLRPADAPAGRPDLHPLAKGFTRLTDLRGSPVGEMARQTARQMFTIRMLRSGRLNPHPAVVKEIAGVDDANDWRGGIIAPSNRPSRATVRPHDARGLRRSIRWSACLYS